jgi:hypothetical protein
MIVSREGLKHFLDYDGQYGDLWESILIPRLRIIRNGLGFSILPVNFKNDPRMTLSESGNLKFVLKRLNQFNNVITSLVKEGGDYRTEQVAC